jgi:hypothetical protein
MKMDTDLTMDVKQTHTGNSYRHGHGHEHLHPTPDMNMDIPLVEVQYIYYSHSADNVGLHPLQPDIKLSPILSMAHIRLSVHLCLIADR